MKNPNDLIWNRNRDLPASSAVPQLNAPLRAPENLCSILWNRVTSIRNIMKSLCYPLVTLLITCHGSVNFWATSCVACRVSGASQSLNKQNVLNKGNYVMEYPSTRTVCVPIFCLSINFKDLTISLVLIGLKFGAGLSNGCQFSGLHSACCSVLVFWVITQWRIISCFSGELSASTVNVIEFDSGGRWRHSERKCVKNLDSGSISESNE
jgi:hypothetical protein